jgi:hypothetical protein
MPKENPSPRFSPHREITPIYKSPQGREKLQPQKNIRQIENSYIQRAKHQKKHNDYWR